MQKSNRALLLFHVLVVVCWSVRLCSAGDIEEDPERKARLFVPVKELSLEDQTLEQAVALLQQLTHANIYLDRNSLDVAGYSFDKKLRLHLYDLELQKTLTVLMTAYGGSDVHLAFGIRNGIIQIATLDTLENSKSAVMLAYDVHDLVERFFTPNDLEAAGLRPSVLTGSPGTAPTWKPVPPSSTQSTNPTLPGIVTNFSRQDNADMLIHLIQETINPLCWRDNGGQIGTVKEIGGLLLVTQTPEGHQQVELVLKNLRKMRIAIDRGELDPKRGTDLLKK